MTGRIPPRGERSPFPLDRGGEKKRGFQKKGEKKGGGHMLRLPQRRGEGKGKKPRPGFVSITSPGKKKKGGKKGERGRMPFPLPMPLGKGRGGGGGGPPRKGDKYAFTLIFSLLYREEEKRNSAGAPLS